MVIAANCSSKYKAHRTGDITRRRWVGRRGCHTTRPSADLFAVVPRWRSRERPLRHIV
jgi:hypothetical protein